MKIVFMGTPDLAAEVLDTMMKNGCEVTLAVTQPDRPKGRGRGVIKTPVHECADRWGIPVFSPVKVKTPDAVQRLREEAPDLIVVAAFGQILSKEILELPRYGCVNVHASLLPKYRGAAPIQWAVIDGEEKSGVTIMQMDVGLDTGDILLQEEIPLAADETGESLYNKMAKLGGELLVKALP
ncbi:MAG: methionyl-tRNA formyltransferase, partial [Lachnospiraceae bacterium]|nr:methionyl-tRNA formyltransferase [Lachnospiraceae bacterium]